MHAAFDSGAYRDMVALARHTTWLNGAANRWSDYGLLLFVVPVVAGLRRNGWRALWVAGAMVAAFALSALTKLAFAEQRPCRTLPSVGHIVALCPPLGDYAFPSNHAVLAGAGAMAVWALDRRLGAVAAVNAVVIAAARVYVGVHYPHDVVAGLLFGALVAGGGTWAGSRLGPPVLRRVRGRRGSDGERPDAELPTIAVVLLGKYNRRNER
ncbi:phosphatase PAP2 family protein [Actinoallomurus bryophytorum]|uniref:Undecaprenyl-diphosphatase n=1 Tax=Actinoallomurus bryophytorum TaxID=1490222 RepID=A0A543CV73_9ACTN|nr:undecaprenyl-diphosphatase [Actinoallomurus bryophytorum]